MPGSTPAPRRLTLEDIEDLRAYERTRDAFRERIIAVKRRRRVAIGPIVSVVFESRDTIRFQVQEMARAERMVSDEQVQGELDVYNALVPEAGELSATVFIELTSESELRHWLPRLVGIERSFELRLPGDDVVRGVPEAAHEEALTRDEVTASVHYVRFALDDGQIDRFAAGPVTLAIAHPAYREEAPLSDDVRAELLADLRA